MRGEDMKSIKRSGIRQNLVSKIDIRPTKLKANLSIRPARSLRKTKIQVETPLRALLKKNIEESTNLED